jgi:hypothetical protein
MSNEQEQPPSTVGKDAPEDRCATCGCDLPLGYMACDETMGHYCEKCWSFVECDERHGEGCATAVWKS